jgi:sialate O-acetylesterase
LARIARRDVYGETIVASGPTFRAAAFEGAAVQVTFSSADGGLVLGQSPWRPPGEPPYATDRLTGFELRGPDGKWRAAEAKIDGAGVTVSHADIAQPTGVRYAWTSAPRANLYNGAGLPAAPFRSDRWEYPIAGLVEQ